MRVCQAPALLRDMGEPSLAKAMLAQASSLESGEEIDPSAKKKLRYETRRLTKKPED